MHIHACTHTDIDKTYTLTTLTHKDTLPDLKSLGSASLLALILDDWLVLQLGNPPSHSHAPTNYTQNLNLPCTQDHPNPDPRTHTLTQTHTHTHTYIHTHTH